MESLFHYKAAPSGCGYLPDQQWSLEYEAVAAVTPSEYLQRMLDGWRRFGYMLFRPACESCRACQSLRVGVEHFRPNRSQKRARKVNHGVVELHIGRPSVTKAKLALYDRYHDYQAGHKGWPEHPAKDASGYADSFVRQPFAVEEWCYTLDGRLIGVGYVDVLADAPPDGSPATGGLSAIYFFYDPQERQRSLGTYNVLCVIDETKRRGLPYAYLGYYVEGCPSMSYKKRFTPHQLRRPDGVWRDY